MSVYIPKRSRWLFLAALCILVSILVATPRRSRAVPVPPATPSAGEEIRRKLEQLQAHQERKEYLSASRKFGFDRRSGGRRCDEVLEQLGAVLDSYRLEHSIYPAELAQLVPDYVDALPVCPSQGKQAYQVSPFGYKFDVKCSCQAGMSYSSTLGLAAR